MRSNPTGFPSLDQFDHTIPDDAEQALQTSHEYPVTADSRFARLLSDRDIITDRHALQRRRLQLVLRNAECDTNEYYQPTYTVAAATYLYSAVDETALIGTISVTDPFQRRGIGTRLKQHVDNHARQDGATTSYTWVASPGGERLAARTGYCPEATQFPAFPEIWVRHYE